jgi:hypothetical protein
MNLLMQGLKDDETGGARLVSYGSMELVDQEHAGSDFPEPPSGVILGATKSDVEDGYDVTAVANYNEQDAIHTCPVCFEMFNGDSNAAIVVQVCGHTFCRECLLEYCENHISTRHVPIPCPSTVIVVVTPDNNDEDRAQRSGLMRWHNNNNNKNLRDYSALQPRTATGCPILLSDRIVERVLLWNRTEPAACATSETTDPNTRRQTTTLWDKYVRLTRLFNDPVLVSCTRCDEVVSPPPPGSERMAQLTPLSEIELNGVLPHPSTTVTPPTPARTCPACQHVFCAVHGDAHLGRTCEEQADDHDDQQQQQQQQRDFWSALGDDTKPCSHCTTPLNKIGGCNHVLCPACRKDMCFQCGSHEHLEGRFIRYCSKCEPMLADGRFRCLFCVIVILVFPVMLLYWTVSFVIVIPFVILYQAGARWPWLVRCVGKAEEAGPSPSTAETPAIPLPLMEQQGGASSV